MRPLAALISLAGVSLAQETLTETIVLADRLDFNRSGGRQWSSGEIDEFSPRSIDELLATDPSFSLFRRQQATFANPTAAGVSLRNTGATAASRSLVLKDGIPQNDPFGGWINWTRYQPGSLESAAITSAAESAVWGNLSPAGSIRLQSRDLFTPESRWQVTGGSEGTLGGNLSHAMVSGNGSLAAGLEVFAHQTDGFHAIPARQRGPIDEPLDLEYAGAHLRFAWRPEDHLTIEPTLSYYDERRGNGTPASGNTTEAWDASLRVTADQGDRSWQALAYYQRRRFSSVFSAVDPSRTSERIALNQFRVPGEGLGGALVHRRAPGEAIDLTAGLDFRWLSGETNEDAGTFRRRSAGGEQGFTGLFSTLAWEASPETRVDVSGRLDYWTFEDGFRHESSLATGLPLRQDAFPDRDDWEPSASILLRRQIDEAVSAHLAAGTSFRAPTINELYRPFRVRSDITEANAALDPERFYSLEAGIQWQANSEWSVGVDLFHHWINDAIANVPVTDPTELSSIFGTLPPGGTGSQRRNVDEAQVTGIQLSTAWQPNECWQLRFDGLWSHTEFTSSDDQPLLEGKPFPQAPDLRLLGSVNWRATDSLRFFAGLEYASHVFDDALATRRIPSYWTCRIGSTWQATEAIAIHLRIENLFDTETPTGLGSNGIRSTGQPRAFWLTSEWRF